jgi:hypothetical protein
MPTDQHAQPPPDPGPPPRRRDHESPAAGHQALTPELRALRDAWLAELWPTCPELPREEREIGRYIAAERAHPHGPGQAA